MITPVSYMQWDTRWKNIPFTSTGNKSQTIGNSGCGPTCAAMVVATLEDKKVTPVEACDYAVIHGYRTANAGTSYGYFTKHLSTFGIFCAQVTPSNMREMSSSKAKIYKDMLINHLENGGWCICVMWGGGKNNPGHWTQSGHYILAYGIDENNKILIRDPNSNKTARTHGDKTVFLSEVKHFWRIETGGEKKVAGLDYNEWMSCYNQMRSSRQDNDASLWSKEAREWAQKNEIVQGSSDGEFNGMWEDELTREQLVTILYRFEKYLDNKGK